MQDLVTRTGHQIPQADRLVAAAAGQSAGAQTGERPYRVGVSRQGEAAGGRLQAPDFDGPVGAA